MVFSTTVQYVFCVLLTINCFTSCFASGQVFWRYLVCKEAWPEVSDNQDAAPEPSPSSGWVEPPRTASWGSVPSSRSAWASAPAGPYSVWVPAPQPEPVASPSGWQAPAPVKWVRSPVPPTRCSLRLDADPWPVDAGCFEETHELDGSLRVYCRLHCESTALGGEIFFMKEDSENTDCIKYVNYNVQLRENDWYAWRSGTCLRQSITFRARCWGEAQPITRPEPEPNGD